MSDVSWNRLIIEHIVKENWRMSGRRRRNRPALILMRIESYIKVVCSRRLIS
jgi:hypothetical protein